MEILDITIFSLIDSKLELDSFSSHSGRIWQLAVLNRNAQYDRVKHLYWGRCLEDPAVVVLLVGEYASCLTHFLLISP
jgi:hypothetical protein